MPAQETPRYEAILRAFMHEHWVALLVVFGVFAAICLLQQLGVRWGKTRPIHPLSMRIFWCSIAVAVFALIFMH